MGIVREFGKEKGKQVRIEIMGFVWFREESMNGGVRVRDSPS